MAQTKITTQSLEAHMREQLVLLDDGALIALHHADIDVVELARLELARRGLDGSGQILPVELD